MMIAAALVLPEPATRSDRQVSAAVYQWRETELAAAEARPLPNANLSDRIRYLIKLDEITRQNLWRMDGPELNADQQRQVGSSIGPMLVEVDAYTTLELKSLLPRSGWFDNRKYGHQITHGAWLIAQHSPDAMFLKYAFRQMAKLVLVRGVDAKDYALTYDRIRVDEGRLQRFGSQVVCDNGFLNLAPIDNEKDVDRLRATIGWSQTLDETKGDLEVGKPCAQ